MKKLLLPMMLVATMFACTSPETKKADAASESADPRTGTFTSQDDKSQKVKELICGDYQQIIIFSFHL